MTAGDLRSPIRILTAVMMVHRSIPIDQARTVLTGVSTSSVRGTWVDLVSTSPDLE